MWNALWMTLAFVSTPPDFTAMAAAIERAVVTSDVELLRDYERQLADDGGGRRYAHAYVNWRLAYALGPGQEDEQQSFLKRAREILEALVEDEPDNAEAHALLGSVIGGQITNPFKGMLLGPKSTRALDRAHDLAPDNPRVAYFAGVSAFFTPGMFGGGMDEAESKLREAEALFQRQSPGAPWPSWGQVDVQAWLGIVLAKNGDIEGARGCFEKGLAMEPDHAWIRNILIPQLDDR